MARTEREYKILREAEKALDSDDILVTQNALLKLLNTYQRLSGRVNKIIKLSDKQQEALLIAYDKLYTLKEQQEESINELIEDKKKRAKNILESKRKIHEIHRKEISDARSNIDELTSMILEKDKLLERFNLLETEYKKLKEQCKDYIKEESENEEKKSLNPYEINETIENLKKVGLEEFIIDATKELFDLEILGGKMDNIHFSKTFLKVLKSKISDDFLSKHPTQIPIDKLSLYVIKAYIEDIMIIIADGIIRNAAIKEKNATYFLSFYNGEIAFDSSGHRFKKPEIIDKNENRWVTSIIAQVALQKESVSKQLREKRAIIENASKKYDEDNAAKLVLESKVFELNLKLEEIALHSGNNFNELKKLKEEYLKEKGEHIKNPDNEEINTRVTLLKEKIDSLDVEDQKQQTEKIEMQNELERCESKIVALKTEIENYKQMLTQERGKLVSIEENYAPLEEKYELMSAALAKAMLSFIKQK